MTVHLEVKKPLLRSWLQHLFKAGKEGELIISKTHDFGQLLCSLVKYSSSRVEKLATHNSQLITLKLPQVRSLASANNYHLYYSKEDTRKLNDYLETLFNIEFDRYYLAGRKKGYQQKEIISTFIVSRNLTGLSDIAGSLKKRNYRREAQLLEEKTSELVNRAYNRNERIIFDTDMVVRTQELYF